MKVFISYSHDDDAHRRRVLEFAQWLRSDIGVDVTIDQFVEHKPPKSWPDWMSQQIRESDVVLIVCSGGYVAKHQDSADGQTGRGVKWEGAIITREVYSAPLTASMRFIPIMFAPGDESWVPDFLGLTTHYVIEHLAIERNEPLIRRLLNQPAVVPAELGPPIDLATAANADGPELADFSSPAVGDQAVFREFGMINVFNGRSVRIRDEYDMRLDRATDRLDIMAFGLRSFREDYGDRLAALAERIRCRVMLLNPDFPDPYRPIAAIRDVEEGNPVGTISGDIERFIDLASGIAGLQLRLYSHLPMMNIFRIDREMFWGPYTVNEQSRNSPTFLFAKGGILFERFEDHFSQVWDAGSTLKIQ